MEGPNTATYIQQMRGGEKSTARGGAEDAPLPDTQYGRSGGRGQTNREGWGGKYRRRWGLGAHAFYFLKKTNLKPLQWQASCCPVGLLLPIGHCPLLHIGTLGVWSVVFKIEKHTPFFVILDHFSEKWGGMAQSFRAGLNLVSKKENFSSVPATSQIFKELSAETTTGGGGTTPTQDSKKKTPPQPCPWKTENSPEQAL